MRNAARSCANTGHRRETKSELEINRIMKNHYERLICLCCFLIFFVNVGLPSTSFNVFQPYLAAEPAVGNTGGSLVLAARTLVSFSCMFFVDRYVNALGARRGAALATVFTSVGFFLFSLANTMTEYFAGAFFAGIGYGLGGMVVVTLITRRWFATGVGTAVGIATMGSGLSSLLLSPIVARIIENISLSWGFRFEALVALALGAVIFALLRDDPAEMGLAPYHKEGAAGAAKASEHNPRKEPLPKPAMAILIVGCALLGAVAIDASNYFSILLTSEGISTLNAATIIALMGLALTVGKFASGFLFDLIGTIRGTIILFAVMFAGLVFACLSSLNPVFPFLAAVLFGSGVTLGSVGISLWSIELSTPDRLTSTVKNLQIAYVMGGFLFSMVPGPLMDLCHSYVISYEILTAAAAVCALIVVGTYLRYAPRSKAREGMRVGASAGAKTHGNARVGEGTYATTQARSGVRSGRVDQNVCTSSGAVKLQKRAVASFR